MCRGVFLLQDKQKAGIVAPIFYLYRMELKIILGLVATHFVADFLCQTDKMALNKSTSLYWLSMHVLTYTAVLFLAVSGFFYFVMDSELRSSDAVWRAPLLYAGINGMLHFITDFFTSKLTSKLWQRESKHWFFVAVGFDQLTHYFCLFVTCNYLLDHV